MRILIVEDDRAISRFLVRGLEEERHVVDLAEDANTALHLVETGEYDAIILDINLPGMNGFDVCRRVRRDRRDTPILMLTARETVGDRITGLDAGADDYLTKPFAFDELLARLRALGRRGRTRHLEATLRYDCLAIHTDTHQVLVHDQIVDLSATEYRLLEYLARRAETIVSRGQLTERLWSGSSGPVSNVIDVYVGYVRRKLSERGASPRLIRTVRGMGYMLKQP